MRPQYSVGLAAVLVLAMSAWAASATLDRPNILLIVIDNIGYGDLGCYGNELNRTPRIDRLAAEGVRLTRFYIASPSCTPSRGSLLTGRHPVRNGLNWQLRSEEQLGIGLPLDEKIIPAYLKPLGYACGAFGKWNIGFAAGGRPTERGFDEFLGHASGNIDYYHHLYDGRLDTYRGTENVRLEGYSTDLFADAAVDFVRRQADRPWFAYVPFNAAHIYNERNTPVGGKTEWQVPPQFMQMYGWQADDPDERRRYAAVLSALDDAIGRILDAVDLLGQSERNFVFLMSDNGAGHDRRTGGHVASNGGLRGGITMCYEGGVRVPAMARWPGHIPAGTTCDEILTSLDLLPTFVAAGGGGAAAERVARGVDLDGIDIRSVLAGQRAAARDLYWQFRDYSAALSGRWKLVRSEPRAAWELYDLSTDSREAHDRAPSHPEVVARLANRYDAWLEATSRP